MSPTPSGHMHERELWTRVETHTPRTRSLKKEDDRARATGHATWALTWENVVFSTTGGR